VAILKISNKIVNNLGGQLTALHPGAWLSWRQLGACSSR